MVAQEEENKRELFCILQSFCRVTYYSKYERNVDGKCPVEVKDN